MEISTRESQKTLDLLSRLEAETRNMIPFYGNYDQAWKKWHEWGLDLIYDTVSKLDAKEAAIFMVAERVPNGPEWIETMESMFR